jgi:hypothetical protein
LRIYLNAPVIRERLAQEATMFGQGFRAARFTKRLQELRRTLDVREQERDGSRRKIAHHSRNHAAKRKTASHGNL